MVTFIRQVGAYLHVFNISVVEDVEPICSNEKVSRYMLQNIWPLRLAGDPKASRFGLATLCPRSLGSGSQRPADRPPALEAGAV